MLNSFVLCCNFYACKCAYGGSAVPQRGVGDRHLVTVPQGCWGTVFPGSGQDKGGGTLSGGTIVDIFAGTPPPPTEPSLGEPFQHLLVHHVLPSLPTPHTSRLTQPQPWCGRMNHAFGSSYLAHVYSRQAMSTWPSCRRLLPSLGTGPPTTHRGHSTAIRHTDATSGWIISRSCTFVLAALTLLN